MSFLAGGGIARHHSSMRHLCRALGIVPGPEKRLLTMKVAIRSAGVRRSLLTSALAAATAAGIVVGLTGLAAAASAPAAAGSAAAGSAAARSALSGTSVPWRIVGPGWDLAVYSAGSGGEGVPAKRGPVTLYLVSPQGGRYRLASWPARSPRAAWSLLAWSGDGQRALFTTGGYGAAQYVHQLTLKTGRVTSFRLPGGTTAIGYTRPDGLNILAQRGTVDSLQNKVTLLRYDLAGQLQKTLATVQFLGSVADQPSGGSLAAGGLRGLVLISNSGGVSRVLPVPGERDVCNAVRWWSAGTVLASCTATAGLPRMWLVPASGARPKALTPVHTNGQDLGDFDAWQLPSGLYMDGYGACGTEVIGRQPAHGPEKIIRVPGSASSLIITATRSRLLVQRTGGCQPGSSLAWFNPATDKIVSVPVPVHGHQFGVVSNAPWFVSGKF
jgi:hypothetical protein